MIGRWRLRNVAVPMNYASLCESILRIAREFEREGRFRREEDKHAVQAAAAFLSAAAQGRTALEHKEITGSVGRAADVVGAYRKAMEAIELIAEEPAQRDLYKLLDKLESELRAWGGG